MLQCSTGRRHTITVSDEGKLYSFGRNDTGQLGLGYSEFSSAPKLVTFHFQIKVVSCGEDYTVCVDNKGYMWSFGGNQNGQLGTGNTITYKIPQRNSEIHPIQSISCGCTHTLILTTDENLWSCGSNLYGQLCLGDKVDRLKPEKTPFSNVSQISARSMGSIFQTIQGEFYGCMHPAHESEVCLISSPLLQNIVQFTSGYDHSLFLDVEGNVFSFGSNSFGQLGHNYFSGLHQIPNIPPIHAISCVGNSSYLLDFDGNVWSFGLNNFGQLGHGDEINRNLPTKIEALSSIKYISSGTCGNSVLLKDSQNKIFCMGNCCSTAKDNRKVLIPEEMEEIYSEVWGCTEQKPRTKSARK